MKPEIIYFSGLFDGEGSVIVRFRKDNRYENGYQITPWVNLTQKNRDVVDKMVNVFKTGKIYYHKRDNLWHVNIYGINNLISFTEKILPYLIVKKKRCEVFLKVLELMKEKKHLTKNGLNNIMTLWDPETEDNAG
jgi:intein-encoded DNA endonuclease-like protein